MMTRQFGFGAVVGVVAGLTLGWVMFSAGGEAEAQPPRLAATAAPPLKHVPVERHELGPSAPESARPATADPLAAAPTSPVAVAARALEAQAAAERIAALEATVQVQQAIIDEREGKRIEFPKDLPERFAPEQMRRAFTEGFKAAGFDKAEVTEVDCSEYPCILLGKGFGDRGDTEKLQETNALAPYAKDSAHTMGWVRGNTNGPDERMFAVALTPDGRELDPAAAKRIEERGRAWQEASRPRKDAPK